MQATDIQVQEVDPRTDPKAALELAKAYIGYAMEQRHIIPQSHIKKLGHALTFVRAVQEHLK